MIFDGFVHQLPDIDPDETAEWVDSFEAVVDQRGRSRGRFLLSKLKERARELQVQVPASVSTPYVNTIPTEREPWFPGDEHVERRIRAFIRWNAAVMVSNANKVADGIGGHLSTFASSAALYDVGFNHFFRGKDDGTSGDAVYYQGHAAPGIYARAYLEGRLSEDDLDHFRREIGRVGLSSYPHPRLMPDFWEYPTVSMGLGPINAIYQARFNRYLQNRRLDDTSASRVWCFLGDGECDEPETLGALHLAARERLDNLIFVINCNLQRLDGPVRGNGKVIQELEAYFRGAGWNVIKVIWGSRWDELLARDIDGALVNKMTQTVDGEYQRYATESGAYIREHFFGPDPRLRQMVEHLSDDDLRTLPRGGHDYRKLYAAYKAAVEARDGAPTVILAKTVKGWTLGPDLEGRNATHQIKKLTRDQLLAIRDRLYLHDEIPEDFDPDDPPYFRPEEGTIEHQYLMDRRRSLGGSIPRRVTRTRKRLPEYSTKAFDELDAGSRGREVSTTMAFTSALRTLVREDDFGERVVPIIPDEARTFGMDSLFREIGIYASGGQLYEPVDHNMLLSYHEHQAGQLLEEGITEAGSMASFTAAGTSYATRGIPMVPFYIYYSMFGYQRVGDLMWAFGDARGRGFLMGATSGRTTLAGEGLQHQDGHSPVLMSVIPNCRVYDPAFAYELGAVLKAGMEEMFVAERDVFYYLCLYNENYEMPEAPADLDTAGLLKGLYRFARAPEGHAHAATVIFSGVSHGPAREAARILADDHDVGVELWSAPSFRALRDDALSADRHNMLRPGEERRTPYVTEALNDSAGPIVAVTDYLRAVPHSVAPWVPRDYTVLGTDGYGRSDTRDALRRFFETDAAHVVVAVLSRLVAAGEIDQAVLVQAIEHHGIEAKQPDPWDPIEH